MHEDAMASFGPQHHRKNVDDNQIVIALKQQMFLNRLQSPAVVLSGTDP
jgi:hypothetical protein